MASFLRKRNFSLRVEETKGLSRTESMLRNEDLSPVGPDQRVWSARHFATFWIADSVNVNTLAIASSAIQAGLSWWQAWLAVWIGYGLVAFVVCAVGFIGSTYHISFPVAARASFGVYGSMLPVLLRAAFAMLWFGIQSYYAGQCITLILSSWAPSYANLKNTLPESAGITTRDFVSFFIFCIIQAPIVLISPEKLRHFFTLKSFVTPIGLIAFLAWNVSGANGLGPIISQPAMVKGSELGWAFVGSTADALNNMVLLALNAPDTSRLASRPTSHLATLPTMPLSFAITSWVGIVLAGSSEPLYGEKIWNPLDLLSRRLQEDPYGSGTRAGIFFIALTLLIGQIGTNLSANSISASADLTGLLPTYLNFKRSALICVCVGIAINPWRLASENSSFSTYLSALSLLMSALLGIMLTDFYLLRRGKLDMKALYSAEKGSTYHYWNGMNEKAYIAWVCGIAPNLPGFIGVLDKDINVGAGAKHIYTLSFFTGSLIAALVYFLLNWAQPMLDTVEKPLSKDNKWLAPGGRLGWEAAEWNSKVPVGTTEDIEAKQVESSDDRKSISSGDEVKELSKDQPQPQEIVVEDYKYQN